MAVESTFFGAELRRRRLAAGLTLSRLAATVHYSTGYLSKIETGLKPASPDVARRCDAALDAGGALAALVAPRPPGARHERSADGGDMWVMALDTDGTGWFRPMRRREALLTGAVSALGFGVRGADGVAGAHYDEALSAFRAMFHHLRELGQVSAPSVVLPSVIAQAQSLRGLAAGAPARVRDDLLTLGARFAEYAGWMAQESGDDRAALWWTNQAVEMAAAGGDTHLAAYGLVRRALVTLYQDDAHQTIALSQLAQAENVPPRIRGLAAVREAQGHALAGDYSACMRCLDRAGEALARDTPRAGAPVLGTAHLNDPVAMTTGWCLYDVGRPRQAAEVLDREIARVAPSALRTRARYGVRLALAYAAAGEIDHACDLAGDLLEAVDATGSATVLVDLRQLSRTLTRFRSNHAVRALSPRLTAALHRPIPDIPT